MKVNEIVQTKKLDEAIFLAPWILPALATAVRIGVPALKLLLKGGKKAVPVAGNTAKTLVKKSTVSGVITGATGMYAYDKVTDVIDGIKKFFDIDMDEDTLNIFAQIVVKYGIPLGAIAAVLYGGKRLKNYIAGEEEKEKAITEERVDEILPVVGAIAGAVGRAALSGIGRAVTAGAARAAVANTISNADASSNATCSCGCDPAEECPCDPSCECGCNAVEESKEIMTEAQFDEAAGEKDAKK